MMISLSSLVFHFNWHPKPDEEWSQEGRAKWLETAANIFDLLYKNSDDNNRVISIRVEKDSAK